MTDEHPRFYDIDKDEFRPITKADVDILMETAQAYGKLRTAMLTVHDQLMAEVKAIRAEHSRDAPAA
jgi:hypothetical protein